jgi:hypothetical protein
LHVELAQCFAHYATGFIVSPFPSKISQQDACFGAFHKDRTLCVRQYARCAVPLPPNHQLISELLFVQDGDLEHRRHIAPQDRQECARWRHHG